MSRIGRAPVAFGKDVQVSFRDNLLAIKGPKGQLEMSVNALIGCEVGEGEIVFTRLSDHRQHRSLHGMVRSIAANMVEGVTSGFKKDLEIRGVGFHCSRVRPSSSTWVSRTRSIWRSLEIKIEVAKDQRAVTVSELTSRRSALSQRRFVVLPARALQGQRRSVRGRVRSQQRR